MDWRVIWISIEILAYSFLVFQYLAMVIIHNWTWALKFYATLHFLYFHFIVHVEIRMKTLMDI